MIHSRLPVAFTLEQRVAEINLLCDRLSQRGAQVQRLRLRTAIELYVVQKIVVTKKLAWEAWCQDNINRSLGDIRKLLKMAAAQDPEAAHDALKLNAKKSMTRTRVANSKQRANTRVANSERSVKSGRQMVSAMLTCHSISEARVIILGLADLADLIAALDEAEAASLTNVVPIHSTATH
jgi:hypothetical protein